MWFSGCLWEQAVWFFRLPFRGKRRGGTVFRQTAAGRGFALAWVFRLPETVGRGSLKMGSAYACGLSANRICLRRICLRRLW
ncbi:hypothetical protein GCWU000324_00027 [Kingella oralis ATCC 51147]|uniref:Uncharacterized protein n=1 Tax=Kingella oralis ATCC 51147 TaxID=629741 RepID=C4GEE4_9NEIS|nr:hypothetical protein GCWU000324_00027 [Kingella oralis ATCC 51147]